MCLRNAYHFAGQISTGNALKPSPCGPLSEALDSSWKIWIEKQLPAPQVPCFKRKTSAGSPVQRSLAKLTTPGAAKQRNILPQDKHISPPDFNSPEKQDRRPKPPSPGDPPTIAPLSLRGLKPSSKHEPSPFLLSPRSHSLLTPSS